jgi:transposase
MLLRYRMALVHMKIRVKNAIHAIMVRYNVGHAYSDLFGRQGRAFLKALGLPRAGRSCLEGWLRLLEFLEGEIARAENSLYRQFRGSMEVELLTSMPGVGTVLAHLILGEIGDIEQFIRPKKLVRYAGLCPSVRQSAKTVRTGHIGGGRKYLAWALIEAARTASWKDPWLARFYERKKRQKGSGKATVAVARKLAIIVWHILKERRAYKSGNSTRPGSARTTSGGRRRASHLMS